MCVHPCLVFPSPQLGLTKRFGRPRAVILMAAKPVEPVESATRSEVESLGKIQSDIVIQRLFYQGIFKDQVLIIVCLISFSQQFKYLVCTMKFETPYCQLISGYLKIDPIICLF